MTALVNIVSPETIHRLGWTLLHFVWQAAAVALILAIVLRLLQRSSANLRYIIACLALALIVLLPAITFHLVSTPDLTSHGESVPIVAPRLPENLHELTGIDMPLPRSVRYMEVSPPVSWTQRARNLLTPALPCIVFAWLIGVLALSIWHSGGWIQLQRLRRKMVKQVDVLLQNKFNELAERLKVDRAVQLVESALVQIPTVVGWVRPVILLPASALTGLTSDQLEALLAHELAHIRRHDYLVNMLQTVVEVLGFYHPAVWWVSHKVRAERENCCDDLAVNICGDTMRYAKALTEMEKLRSGYAELALAANGANLSRRISRLIGKDPVRKTRRCWAPAAIAATLVIALAIPTTLALSGSYSEDTPAAVVNDAAAPTTTDGTVPSAPVLAETPNTRQILLDCKLLEVPCDSESLINADGEQLAVGSGKDAVGLLAGLIGEPNVRVLAHPQMLISDGKEASMAVGADMPYVAGYEPSADAQGRHKPITKSVFDGIELQVKGETVGSNGVDLNVHLMRSKPSFGRQKDHSGRETQTPKLTCSDTTTAITIRDGETILIGGLKDDGRADDTVILMITPHIIHKADAGSVFAEADFMTEPSDDTKRVKPAEDPVAMAIRQALVAAEKLRVAGKQVDNHREVLQFLSEQGYTIKAADFSTDKYNLVISKPINGDDDRKGQLVVRLTNQNDEWLIDNIDFKSTDGVKDERAQIQWQAPETKRSVPTDARHAEVQDQGLENLLSSLDYLAASQADAEPKHADEALLRALEYLYPDVHRDSEHAKYALLAAHFAQKGNFKEAIKYQEKAIELAKAQEHYGIGIAFEKFDSGIRVTDVVAGAPAEKAGLESGDIIEAVNGQSIKCLSQYTAAARICGPKNSNVRLTVKSPGQDTSKELALKREFLLQGWPGLQEYQWRLDAYKAAKAWPEYRRAAGQTKDQSQQVTTIFDLKYVDCKKAARVLADALRSSKAKEGDTIVQGTDQVGASPDIRILPDTRSNRLLVCAGEQDMDIIEALIAEVDVSEADGKETINFQLKYAEPEQVAAILKQLLTDTAGLTLVPQPRTNRLLVHAGPQDIKKVEDLIERLDVASYKEAIEDTAPKQDQTKFGYVDVTAQEHAAARAEQLNVLKDQRKALADKLQSLREEARLLQREYGTTDLTWRQEMKLQRIANLLNELAKIESRRLRLESELLLLERSKDITAAPQELLKARQEYTNSDPTVKALAEKIAQVEMELSLARQTFTGAHPEVEKKTELLKALNKRLSDLKQDLAETFDEQMTEQAAEAHKRNVTKASAQLEQTKAYEHHLRETLQKEDAELIDLGRGQLRIQGLQEQLALSKAKYDQISRRIEALELKLKAPTTTSDIRL